MFCSELEIVDWICCRWCIAGQRDGAGGRTIRTEDVHCRAGSRGHCEEGQLARWGISHSAGMRPQRYVYDGDWEHEYCTMVASIPYAAIFIPQYSTVAVSRTSYATMAFPRRVSRVSRLSGGIGLKWAPLLPTKPRVMERRERFTVRGARGADKHEEDARDAEGAALAGRSGGMWRGGGLAQGDGARWSAMERRHQAECCWRTARASVDRRRLMSRLGCCGSTEGGLASRQGCDAGRSGRGAFCNAPGVGAVGGGGWGCKGMAWTIGAVL